MNKYLETGELTEAEIIQGIRMRTIAAEIQPMFCGTAFKNKGVQRMLDGVIDFMPSPIDIPPVPGIDDDDKPTERRAADDEKFAAFARSSDDRPLRRPVDFVRVYSGVLKSGDTVSTRPAARKSASAGSADARQPAEEIKEILAGDIAACVGLKDVTTARRWCDRTTSSRSRRMIVPSR